MAWRAAETSLQIEGAESTTLLIYPGATVSEEVCCSVGVGQDALSINNNSYGGNVALGFGAMKNSTGNANTAVGNYAGEFLEGSNNVAIGAKALMYSYNGVSNVAVGHSALNGNPDGSFNVAVGQAALGRNTSGSDNVAIGKYAISMPWDTSGNKITAVGSESGTETDGLVNATALGYAATVAVSNAIQLGNNEITSVSTSGQLTTGAVTYPNTDGVAGQVLATDGSGVASWVNAPSPQLTSDTCGGQNTCELSCPENKIATGGGCSGQAGLRETRPTANLAGWYCRDETMVDLIYVICR